MQIWLNGQAYTPVAADNLLALVHELSLPEQSLAMSVAGNIVPRSQWQQTPLTEGIQIALFQAIAGG